jgi:hypothetical protein
VVFTLVWIAWANGSLHHELHGHDDARARITFLLQILVLAAMGASIPQAGGARGRRSPSPRQCCKHSLLVCQGRGARRLSKSLNHPMQLPGTCR